MRHKRSQLITTYSTIFQLFILFLSQLPSVLSVDHSNFKTCAQSSFCKRQRSFNKNSNPSTYSIDKNTISIQEAGGRFSARVKNDKHSNVDFSLTLHNYDKEAIRLVIDENSQLFKRFDNKGSYIEENLKSRRILNVRPVDDKEVPGGGVEFEIDDKPHTVKIHYSPIKISFHENGKEYFNINSKNLLNIEHFRVKPENSAAANSDSKKSAFSDDDDEDEDDDNDDFENDSDDFESDDEPKEVDLDEVARLEKEENELKNSEEFHHEVDNNQNNEEDQEIVEGQWDESFKSHKDSKPRGPESIGLDLNFVNYKYLYGLPEHADRFWLKDTKRTDPYRLYNLDVFEYELDETMALYGSVPWIMAHNNEKTFGVLWLNPSETWVDIEYSEGSKGGIFSSASKDVATSRFMSESGTIDIWIMNGPTPKDTLDQLTYFTGRPTMPTLWSIAYHQCRWNYRDMQDVENVDKGFEDNDIPYDVIWLDIEHTDGKRYFTWDKVKFSDPTGMIDNIARTGRKMVTIVDPHIKIDNSYSVYKSIKDAGLMVKDKNNKDFEGWCWPGNSGYPDFTNPKMRELWANHFNYDQYIGSTQNLFTWNDMNEPSVFNGPEVTMHKDAKHMDDWEHRHVHNLYGYYVHKATWEGQIVRNQQAGKLVDRPFVLSRAFYVGTQTAGAIWTGDNKAEWDHMRYSVPMCMSVGISGIPFVGADVGGFFGNPSVELLVRWYQTATTQPFYRAHAHIDSKRREPWLFGEQPMNQIRTALRFRYRILNYIYNSFYESTKFGSPVMRPIFWEFPKWESFYGEELEWMTGDSILSVVVPDEGQDKVEVRLPGEVWYKFPFEVRNFSNDNVRKQFQVYNSGVHKSVPCSLDEGMPVFLRSGKIILTKERPRRNSELMAYDPYTIYIALDKSNTASGSHYEDNYRSIKSSHTVTHFKFENGKLFITFEGNAKDDDYKTDVERIVILLSNGQHFVRKTRNDFIKTSEENVLELGLE